MASDPQTTAQQVVGCGCVGVLVVVGGLMVLGALFGPEREPRPPHDKIGAYIMCQRFVSDRLRAPGSARFPPGADDFTTDLGNGRYRVRGHVDAQNAFGALLRNEFECEVQWVEDDRWRLEDITMVPR